MRKNLYMALGSLLVVFVAVTFQSRAQQQQPPQPESKESMKDCPMMKRHGAAAMNERGEHGMGFSQTATTHHFYLTKTGGIIQVEANDASDTTSREAIRQHLSHIAMAFAGGDFDIPMFVHDGVPPGVPEMKRLKSALSYRYEETERGGRVLITSKDESAVHAIQDFLRFQITEHKTGDPLEAGRR